MPERSDNHPCRDHVRRYLQAPFLADLARRAQIEPGRSDAPWSDLVTPGVPPSLGRALEEWAVAESTPDEEIATFVDWPVAKVREHR